MVVPGEVVGDVVKVGPVDHCHSVAAEVSCCEGSHEVGRSWSSQMVDLKSWDTQRS